MGEANNRGSYEDRRNARLDQMVETAEIICTFRVDERGELRMETLARDEPVDETSPAIGFVEFLHANWKDLAGQALALKTSALAAKEAGRTDTGGGTILLANGQAANDAPRDPVLLGPTGRVISCGQDGPRVELPASVATREES